MYLCVCAVLVLGPTLLRVEERMIYFLFIRDLSLSRITWQSLVHVSVVLCCNAWGEHDERPSAGVWLLLLKSTKWAARLTFRFRTNRYREYMCLQKKGFGINSDIFRCRHKRSIFCPRIPPIILKITILP